jgi:putative SOS response-associated peptidase YedK
VCLTPTKSGELRLAPPPRTHFNSRKDTLLRSRGWQNLLHRNRCVVLIDSFFEWSDEEMLAGRPKMVGRYRLTYNRLMPVAGIWSTTRTPSGPVQTFSVITCEPNALLSALPHHRMPALLLGNDLQTWLDPTTEHPETVLHSTDPEEFDSILLPARNYPDLVR